MSSSNLAINGGLPVRAVPWPPPHYVDSSDEARLLAALSQDNWSNGDLVQEFEQRFAAFCGCRHALLVVNGTAALKLILLAAGIRPGDEVIIPGMTWPSVAIAIMECGADPVPADVERDTYGLSVESVLSGITESTKAIIATHLFCSQTDLMPILNVARSRGIAVIEDASHAVGATRNGKSLGATGIAGFFSFNQKKLLTCGEGGCLVTNDDQLFDRAMRLREVRPGLASAPEALPGTYMVSEFQAAVLLSQLDKLPGRLRQIESQGEILRSRVSRIEGVEVLARLPETGLQTFYHFCFRLGSCKDIVWFRKALSAELGLRICGAYPPLSEVAVLDTTKDSRLSHLGRKMRSPMPNCRCAHHSEAVRFHHRALLGGEPALLDIERAIRKVVGQS